MNNPNFTNKRIKQKLDIRSPPQQLSPLIQSIDLHHKALSPKVGNPSECRSSKLNYFNYQLDRNVS